MFSYDRKTPIVFAALVITMAASNALLAQPGPKTQPLPKPVVAAPPPPDTWQKHSRHDSDTTERSIKADPKINVSLCVSEGSLKVNGWNRNEVRVFVSNGSKFGVRVQYMDPKSGDPALISIISATDAKNKNKNNSSTECIYGDEIEIDAPHGAVLNLRGQEITTTIEGIRRVDIKNAGGDISVSNITEAVNALTYNGDLTVEQSYGPMMLETTRGNILVFDVGPSEIGDIFKATTSSGAISVQKLAHRRAEVKSISGTVFYTGEIQKGGWYSFINSNGTIKLAIPADSSCDLYASYGGAFSSDFPLKILTEDIRPGFVKSVAATLGKIGYARLKITTNNGSISIKKQP